MYYCTKSLNFLINFKRLLAPLVKMRKCTNAQALTAARTNNIGNTCRGALGKQDLAKKRKSLQVFLQSRQLVMRKSRRHRQAKQAFFKTFSPGTANRAAAFYNSMRYNRYKSQNKQNISNKYYNHTKKTSAPRESFKRTCEMRLKVHKLFAALCYRKRKASNAAYRLLCARQPRKYALFMRNKWFASHLRKAVDFENIICTSNSPYLWVYFFHNQLPRCPPPSLASLTMPTVPAPSLISVPSVVKNSANVKQSLAAARKTGGAESILRTSSANVVKNTRSNSVALPGKPDQRNTLICYPAGCRPNVCPHQVNPARNACCPLPNAANRSTATDGQPIATARASRASTVAEDTNTIAVTAPSASPSTLNVDIATQTMSPRPSARTTGRNTTSSDVNVLFPPAAATTAVSQTPVSNRATSTADASVTLHLTQSAETNVNRNSLEVRGSARRPSTLSARYPSIANAYGDMRQSYTNNLEYRERPPNTIRNSSILSTRENGREQVAADQVDPVIGDLQRASTQRRLSVPTPRPSNTSQQNVEQEQSAHWPPLKFKLLPTAATVYSTQYYKPDETKHCQLKTPYYPNARYPPVYSVYTTPSMLRFKHRNVIAFNEKTLEMEDKKPLSPIGARRRSLRSKTEAAQNTIYCNCRQSINNEMLKPCACPDPPSEISCTCTPPIKKCSCQMPEIAEAKQNKRNFKPDTRKILRRCITTGGGFEPNHVNQFFQQVRRAIKKGRISKCNNPYCGKCYKHPSEHWYYRINRNVFRKTRCREVIPDGESCCIDEAVVEELSEMDSKEETPKMPCDYTKGKKQYDTMNERELKMKGYNKALEVDSENLNFLLNKAFQLRKKQYDGEPCVKDSETLYARREEDEELYERFRKFNMHVPETEYELCPVEEEFAEDEFAEFLIEENSFMDETCPESVKASSSDTDANNCANLLSAGDLDDILKRRRCENNAKKFCMQRNPLCNWYAPLSTIDRCPTVSISQIPKKFKI